MKRFAADVAPMSSRWAGESGLVNRVAQEVAACNERGELPMLLNIGAGTDTVVEKRIARTDDRFCVDRIDVVPSHVSHPNVNNEWAGTIESMPQAPTATYSAVFGNFVLEHVGDVDAALMEVARTLLPEGLLVLTLPNPRAVEFLVAKHSPRRLHRLFQPAGFSTAYAYRSIPDLAARMQACGFSVESIVCSPVTSAYLQRALPRIAAIGKLYDSVVLRLRAAALCGETVIVARKC